MKLPEPGEQAMADKGTDGKGAIIPAQAPSAGIDYFRDRVLLYLLMALAGFGAIAYLPSVYYGYIYRFYSVILIDTLTLGWVFFLLARRRLTFRTKALGLLGVFYTLGVWLLVTLGPTGAGFMWLLLFSIMTGILLGYKPALISFGINLATVVALSVPVFEKLITWKLIHADAVAIWTVKGVNFICINAIVSASTGFLITKIARMAEEAEQRALALAREIAARQEAEEEAKALTARLYQAQKMEALGTLAGGVAHDFNNILGTIMGYTEFSLMENGLSKTVHNSLTRIQKAAELAKGITGQILTFCRQSPTLKTPCDLGRIAAECLDIFSIRVPPNVTLAREIPSGPVPILADKNQISQVIMNLLTNSLQAITPADNNACEDKISLTLKRYGSAADKSIPPCGGEDLLRVTVTDTGKGIPEDQLARIFEPYFTTKAPGKGTGMGLSIAHGIVRDHGGDILVESAPGRGCTVSITLPVHSGG